MINPVKCAGKFVTAAIKHSSSLIGSRIYMAVDYYTPERIVHEFSEVTGRAAKFIQLNPERYEFYSDPPNIGEEMLQSYLLLEDPGYYAGINLDESLALLDEKPTTWRKFVAKSGVWT